MSPLPATRVAAAVVAGSPLDRALLVALAEAGVLSLALGTVNQADEFAVASIANELWAIGAAQSLTVMDGRDPPSMAAYADEVWDRFGRCDLLVCCQDFPTFAPVDEISMDEWRATLSVNLTSPFLAIQAFGRLMDRQGGGMIVVVIPHHAGIDAAYAAARDGLRAFAAAVEAHWGAQGVHVRVLDIDPADPVAAGRALVHLVEG